MPPPDAMTQEERANQLAAICHKGFRNEHHWQAWLRKYGPEIRKLPPELRDRVLLAHDQATVPEFSERRPK